MNLACRFCLEAFSPWSVSVNKSYNARKMTSISVVELFGVCPLTLRRISTKLPVLALVL